MRTLSPSGLDLAARCAASCALPEVVRPPSDAMARGTAIHAYLEDCARLRDGQTMCIDTSSDVGQTCAAIDTKALFLPGAMRDPELALAYDVSRDAARRMTLGAAREYGALEATEIPGTIDLVERAQNGSVRVTDYKTGQTQVAVNAQLRLYSLMVARWFGVDEVTVRIIQIAEDGRHVIREEHLDWLALDAVARETERVWREVQDARREVRAGRLPTVRTGAWCERCTASAACPAFTGLARAVLADMRPPTDGMATATDEELGALWSKAQFVSPILETITAALKAEIQRRGSVPLPSGERAAPQAYPVRSVDGAVADEVLLSRWGVGLSTPKKATLKDLEQYARECELPLDEVLAAVDAAGGIHQKTITKIITRKAS